MAGLFAQEQRRADEERRVSDLLSVVLDTWGWSTEGPAARPLDRLIRCCDSSSGARAVVGVLTRTLDSVLAGLWRHGWQPADLHRLAVRRLGTVEQQLLLDAIAAHMRGYAPGTVDPRWTAQLRDLEARVWWPEPQTHLESRASTLGWAVTVHAAVAVVDLAMRLPPLETLMPAPGDYRPDTHRRAPGKPVVEERILQRVRALLAKAESTNFEAEAETFTAGAQALMARHSIDAALLAAQAPVGTQRPGGRRIGLDNPYEGPKAMLLDAVAAANRCRLVWSKELGFATVIGFEPDLDAVDVLFTSLLVQATRAMTAAGRRTDRHGRSRTRTFRSSFLSAYAGRIGERLREVAAAQVEQAAAEAAHHATESRGVDGRSTSSRGRELVPLLAARSAEVDEAVEAMFPELTQRRVGGSYDIEGWASGRAAADLASLGRGAALPDRQTTATG